MPPPEPGCEPEPKLAPEGAPDAVEPPAVELPATPEPPAPVEPPADTPPPDFVPPEWLPPHEDDEVEEPDEVDGEEADERSMFGGGPAGTASESTNTSPRMCSTNCEGTPDGLTGCVKTTCSPVAVTVSSLAAELPPVGSNGFGAAFVSV